MTPKEKAKQLIELFTFSCRECDNSKISALIAVNEIIEITQHESPSSWVYYMEVKKEIEAL
jgi:hypothetical protein